MVDKLRKAGLWIWLFKERIILLVMVGALANQVYMLVYPAPPEVPPTLQAPRSEAGPDADPSIIPPEPPGPPPRNPPPGGHGGLVERNPYWYYASTGEDKKANEIPADLIQLIRIQTIGNRVRCQLRTRNTTTKWYEVGEKFEEFQVREIDAAAGTATVFVESYGKSVVLTAQS